MVCFVVVVVFVDFIEDVDSVVVCYEVVCKCFEGLVFVGDGFDLVGIVVLLLMNNDEENVGEFIVGYE